MSTVEQFSAGIRLRDSVRALIAAIRGTKITYPLGYMATLDGARGMLTVGILVAHTRPSLLSGAIIYMDVFFTMSGYLITSILIKDYQNNGRISLKNFYIRRIMRLYPALTLMVISFITVSWFFAENFKERATEALVSWFYLMNYWGLMGGSPVLYTGHTWSLAVEEQFYLIWPLAFIALLKFSGITVRTAAIIFAAALSFWIWRGVLTYNGAPIGHLYTAFDTRADALLIGCGLAVLLKAIDIADYPRIWTACAYSLVPLALLFVCIGLSGLVFTMRWYYYVSPLLGAIPAAIALVGLLHPDQTIMHRLYQHPIPVFIGRICYGLYLWHLPIFVWILSWSPGKSTTVLLVGWPLVFAIATLSFYLVERPFMRARPGF